MSLLIKGRPQSDWFSEVQQDGEYVRTDSQFRNWITPDGSPGPSGEGGFAAEPGRYHLYVSHACPWANRTLIFRALKGLQSLISYDVVDPVMPEDSGWFFTATGTGTSDSLYGFRYCHQLYTLAQPDYTGIVTVPVLWDKQRRTIVNNESSEIIRMLNSAFDHLVETPGADFYPAALRPAIDEINALVYENINNGVYRCGFATSQAAYEQAYERLFDTLDRLEARLAGQAYLVGDTLTEADWRLFTSLVRFDPVYYVHFKCNRQRLRDFPNLWSYTRALYQMPGVADTVHMDHIKTHYYRSHLNINPVGLVPVGPRSELDTPHDRDRFNAG